MPNQNGKLTPEEAAKLNDYEWAKAFYRAELEGTGISLEGSVSVLEEKLAAVRDAVLVEAAKAMCPICNDGEVIVFDELGLKYVVFRHLGKCRCDAPEIHRLRLAAKELK